MKREKNVDFLIGVPCSGKTTYRNKHYTSNDFFVISRDDLREDLKEKYGFNYDDFFKKPQDGDKEDSVLGYVTAEGNWSNVEKNK